MEFDIIDITDEALNNFSVAQMKLLRAAQEKKNALYHKMHLEYVEYLKTLRAAGLKDSTLKFSKYKALFEEFEYQCEVIAEELKYNLNVSSSGGNGAEANSPYLVDYSLSYNERYKIVRDYYLTITDREERMKRYAADDIAKNYLGTYYATLYNVLSTIDK